MIPGMNPKQLKQMQRQMKKMGMDMKSLDGAQEVIIRFEDKELIINDPEVNVMNVMGQENFQITGNVVEVEREMEIVIPDEDVEMVANQAGVSLDAAREALEESKGDLAEAILNLNS
ncbi:MAG: nascent polypeptide-associated complex protein [archaeon]|nr:nascent polypeptide-associated complex protein [archaeon]